MMNEKLILDLLDKADEIIDLIDKFQDEALEDMKHNIYDAIIDSIGVDSDFEKREPYYEILFKYESKLINKDQAIEHLKLVYNS